MEIQFWSQLSPSQQQCALERPAITESAKITTAVTAIRQAVKQKGDEALVRLTQQFDGHQLTQLCLTQQDIEEANQRLPQDIKTAIQHAYHNIEKFHQAQLPKSIKVETQTGVVCESITRPIESVGLYIPGGSAPLPSTVLMLGIPAKLAQCKNVVLCSPPPISDEILYAATLCGIQQIHPIGGAQAIAAMAYGTDSVQKVDKIFGPGNAFVTEAKQQVSQDHQGAAIDMPAGPSEVLVIADEHANAEFIAADLLSQAEHGPDSQVILLTPSADLAQKTQRALDNQLATLPRREIATQALAQSRILITRDLDECVTLSNRYGPEHLIIQTQSPRAQLAGIAHAGSVFLGKWSPESVGDYASGTNHVLPTYGHTRTYSSLGMNDFFKRMTVQELTFDGLQTLAPSVLALAKAEKLMAHHDAVAIRLTNGEDRP